MATAEGTPSSAAKFQMVDVGDKAPTKRRAVAQGRLRMGAGAFALLRDRKLPKGDALTLAEVAGIGAAKRTAELIPLCHPLALDAVRVWFDLDASQCAVIARCEASAYAKTGVEMEALTGVSGALLALYDLIKQVDAALTISDVRLDVKEGGKTGRFVHPECACDTEATRAARPLEARPPLDGVETIVVTLSDRVVAATAEDKSGPLLAAGLETFGARVVRRHVLPDDRARLVALLREEARRGARLIVTTGGTGVSPRDLTPEALAEACDRMIPGIGERLRASGSAHTPAAWLSRSTAGLIGETLVVALPGSPKAVQEGLVALGDLLPHALQVAHGGQHHDKNPKDSA